MSRTSAGEFELMILFCVLRLERSGGYGPTIRRAIVLRTRRSTAIGAIYTALWNDWKRRDW